MQFIPGHEIFTANPNQQQIPQSTGSTPNASSLDAWQPDVLVAPGNELDTVHGYLEHWGHIALANTLLGDEGTHKGIPLVDPYDVERGDVPQQYAFIGGGAVEIKRLASEAGVPIEVDESLPSIVTEVGDAMVEINPALTTHSKTRKVSAEDVIAPAAGPNTGELQAIPGSKATEHTGMTPIVSGEKTPEVTSNKRRLFSARPHLVASAIVRSAFRAIQPR